MQSVSQEWIDNQGAIIRKPGFIIVDIPEVRIPCGAVSHRTLYKEDSVLHLSDPVGCDYINKCGIEIMCDTDLLGSSTVVLRTLDDKATVLTTKEFTISDLDTNGVFYWEMPGFSKIEVEVLDAIDSVEDIQLYAYGIPRNDIQSYSHSKSYDPMGFELPTNDIAIDVYNYQDKYTSFYKQYSNEGYVIKVRYGYKLDSGDEIIKGGTFHLTDVQLLNNIITITGDNALAFVDTKTEVTLFELKAKESGCIRMEITDDSLTVGPTSVIFNERPEVHVTAEDLINILREKAGLSIACNQNYDDIMATNLLIKSRNLEICQSLTNLLLNRCYIDREDVLHYDVCTDKSISKGNHILLKNSMSEPEYSVTKKVKTFEISTSVMDNVNTYYEEGTSTSEANITYTVSLDFVNNYPSKIYFSTGAKCIYWVELYPDKIRFRYRMLDHSKVALNIEYGTMKPEVLKELVVDTSGTLCDITSPLGEPSDVDKIARYFTNRDLYTFNVRGNPARDVGDYVDVSLTNDDDPSTYKKGLVLSSILTYDGSFKEECTVRIIENDFE